jgi:outer membrane protein assembly factor BamE (lipoprotein component of BamABCDE complex)
MKTWKTMTSWLVTLAAMAIMLSILPSCDTPKTDDQSVKEGTTDQANVDQLYEGMTRKIKINIGTSGERRHVYDARGLAFGGMAALVGTGRNQRAHVYTATLGEGPLVPGSIEKIDAKKLAEELGVVACVLNIGRNWVMDEIDMHLGEVVDFQGVKMAWAGDMTSDEIMQHFGKPYFIGKILRNTNWIYKAGKPVYLLREPGGLVWVMQEYTTEVDPSLTIDNLDQVGSKLKNLPEGWKFETVILQKDLTLDTRRTGTWASIIRDDLGNTYECTGFDDLANYIP